MLLSCCGVTVLKKAELEYKKARPELNNICVPSFCINMSRYNMKTYGIYIFRCSLFM